ncbi:RagB/SusD family nutrient uptake outer membrane protein [Hymenobacter sp. BT770]|uniref:RagB/SusD family nutrient uptake outer membrane protein n=1 Tax=Hymenobacter sp. BT770 TaxID=2886942 RepID=UPI001D10051E|nr:RagB/SusD family nutrient uptake outer membrane protein [Hymenobacter sp. BT770]MCC3154413.1 RagB/SusD family nutrient uptake outer membrane protein [Hymenobacter sp. BT770]MDO3416284.1 RagB/SusD family nutrient uptake outer membrane protein [Hymenobacter sp. BT770]
MKFPKIPALLLAGSLLLTTGCEKDLLDKTNPNAPSTAQFWKTQDDAVKGVYACYSGLQQFACYYRSWHFMVHRSDESYSQSPFVELANFTRFVTPDNNFFISSFAWNDYYRTIFRTNQVVTHVPEISMDGTLKKRLIAEAKFVRALSYFDLVYLFGNVPLIVEEPIVTTRVKQATPAETEAQIIADLQSAIPDLPLSYPDAEKGRATKGSAQALLAKVYMQQRKWAEASALFTTIIDSKQYSLVNNYLDNFTDANENNQESVFEVQFTGAVLEVGQGQDNASSSESHDRPNFFGPPGPTFADVQPRRWLLDEYKDSTVNFAPNSTKKHLIDPRRDISIIHVGNPDKFYGKTFAQWNWNPNQQYWRKYLNDRTRTDENFTSGINHRVIRYADVLLMQAEALTELNQMSAALPLINLVRQRPSVNLAPLTGTYTQNALRLLIRSERAKELAGEGTRWFDILRWGLMDNQAGIDELKTRDSDFANFRLGISKLLPIPQRDIDIDPGVKQNPGY